MAIRSWLSYTKDLKRRQELYAENGQEFCEDLYSSEEDYLEDKEKESALLGMKENAKMHNGENQIFQEVDIVSDSNSSYDSDLNPNQNGKEKNKKEQKL